MQNYFLTATGRARSGALNHSLKVVGCGNPNDYFLPDRWPEFYAGGIEGIRPFLESKRVNGFLGVRAPWGGHIGEMCAFLKITFTEFIERYMPDPKFVYVTRDPLRQALELRYIEYDQSPDYDDPVAAIRADKENVYIRQAQVLRAHQAWQTFFEMKEIEPYRMSTYDLIASPEIIVPAVCEFLGYELPTDAHLTHGFVDGYSILPILDELEDEFMQSRARLL